jgi:hypothetical protein
MEECNGTNLKPIPPIGFFNKRMKIGDILVLCQDSWLESCEVVLLCWVQSVKCTWHVMGNTGNFILSRKCPKSVYYLSEGQIVWTFM